MSNPKRKSVVKKQVKPKSRAKTEKISPSYRNLIKHAKKAVCRLWDSNFFPNMVTASELEAAIDRCEIIDGVK